MPELAWAAADVMTERLDGDDASVRAAAALLSEAERQRAARFAFERDRRRFVLSRAGLRRQLAFRLGVPAASIELAPGRNGKPELGGRFAASGLRFNLSRGSEVAVYAFARGHEVGVDVEAVRAIEDADRIAERVFSPAEYEAYRALGRGDRALGFFNCWTRKEAFVKATGEGLLRSLARFDVSLAPGAPARILRVDATPGDWSGWWMEAFTPSPGYVAAVVAEVA